MQALLLLKRHLAQHLKLLEKANYCLITTQDCGLKATKFILAFGGCELEIGQEIKELSDSKAEREIYGFFKKNVSQALGTTPDKMIMTFMGSLKNARLTNIGKNIYPGFECDTKIHNYVFIVKNPLNTSGNRFLLLIYQVPQNDNSSPLRSFGLGMEVDFFTPSQERFLTQLAGGFGIAILAAMVTSDEETEDLNKRETEEQNRRRQEEKNREECRSCRSVCSTYRDYYAQSHCLTTCARIDGCY